MVRKRTRNLLKDSSGLATIEFAIASTVLVLGLLNGLEVARWSFKRMEIRNAVHVAAHAAWNACDTQHLPAKTNCSGLGSAITAAVNSTSLGAPTTGPTTTEGYYCVASGNVLKKEADYTATKPANCSVEGYSANPGDYLTVTASYSYTPLFGASLTVGHLMPSTLSATSTIRLQ